MRIKDIDFVKNMLKSCTSKFEDRLWSHQIKKAIFIMEREKINQKVKSNKNYEYKIKKETTKD